MIYHKNTKKYLNHNKDMSALISMGGKSPKKVAKQVVQKRPKLNMIFERNSSTK